MTPEIFPRLSPDQRIVVDTIYDMQWNTGNLPTYGEIYRKIRDAGVSDGQQVIHELVPLFVHRSGFGPEISDTEVLSLTLLGGSRSQGASTVTNIFFMVLPMLVEMQEHYVPSRGNYEPTIYEHDVVKLLTSSYRDESIANFLARRIGLFFREESNIFNGFTPGTEILPWSMEISQRVQIFKGVGGVEEYLEKVKSELEISETKSKSSEDSRSQEEIADQAKRKRVLVVHGRDKMARQAVLDFLSDLGLEGVLWEDGIAATGSATPYTLEAVKKLFTLANAVIVLFTPDDIVTLHPDFYLPGDSSEETGPTSQVRPNVLLEAGMAFTSHPEQTVIVEIGHTRPVTDLAGLNTIRIRDERSLEDLAKRLENAQCNLDKAVGDWANFDRFSALSAYNRNPTS